MQDFLAGRLPCIPGELPTLNDWENHLTTIFPEVHSHGQLLKCYAFWVPLPNFSIFYFCSGEAEEVLGNEGC